MSFLRSLLISTPLIALSTVVTSLVAMVLAFFDRSGNSAHAGGKETGGEGTGGESATAFTGYHARPGGLVRVGVRHKSGWHCDFPEKQPNYSARNRER